MGSRRTLILVGAVVVGALAAFLTWGYVGGIQDKAYGNAALVKVFVVKQQVTKGTYGTEAEQARLIVKDEVPKEFLPANAVRDLGDVSEMVAVNDLAVNQIVTSDMFADSTVVESTMADRLEKIQGEDQVAVTISVDAVHGVAGLLQPGDYVNLMATAGEAEAAKVPPGEPVPDFVYVPQRARLIYQKVQILAIDQTPVAQPGEAAAAAAADAAPAAGTVEANPGLITLILPAKAAQYVASLAPGAIYLALVPRDYEPKPLTQLEVSADPKNPLPGETSSQLTPYGPKGPGGE